VPAIKARHAVKRAKAYMRLLGEIDRLTAENADLKEWEWRAKLAERKVTQLRGLLNAVDEPALHFATGTVIADARGPFLRSALINLGRDQGVRVGYAVVNGDGLVGRTVVAGSSVARVLLLNDLNSRVPVLVGPAAVRALLLGDNSAELQIDFVAEGATLYPGDEVYTSGSDGVLPRGLRIGVVTGVPGALKVKTYAELSALDTVSVLFFDTPELTATDPPAVPPAALSADPEGSSNAATKADATDTAGALPVGGAIKQAGTGEAETASRTDPQSAQ
jgi:rod shape-determining protein MreC